VVDRHAGVTRLTDVARLARVSTATVSRILNARGPFSDAARERVLRAARELDYHPNGLARSLRRRCTDTIGLVLPDIENPFFTSLVKGVEREAWSRGWNVILANTDEDIEREKAMVRALVDRRIDGMILCPAAGSHEYLQGYLERRLPVVAANRLVPDVPIPAVTSDNKQGAHDALRHLLAAGLAPVAVIVGTPGLSTTEARLAGCRQAVAEHGLPEDSLVVRVGYGRLQSGHKAALECLEALPRPRALFAFNNLMAEAALMAIHQRGLRCPEDVALVGFDDFRSAAALSPPLTVVEQDPEGIGARAVAELAQILRTGAPSQMHLELPARLLLRASCGCRSPGRRGRPVGDGGREQEAAAQPGRRDPRRVGS
jgi:LacI family transcriptional regulator